MRPNRRRMTTTPTTDTKHTMRAPAVAGLAGTAALTTGLALLSTLWTKVPFVPVNIAQRVVRITSGQVNSFFIDRLGHWAQRLALLGTCFGFVVAGFLAVIVVRALAGKNGRAAPHCGGSRSRPSGRSRWACT